MFSTDQFTAEKCFSVLKESKEYLASSGRADFIRGLTNAYFPVAKLIPIPIEAMLSGTLFPWMESHNDLQISSILASFGLYKQAHASLRSALELALQSVYWNIDDDGHVVIQGWVRSRDGTPFVSKVWKRLMKHPNFVAAADTLELEERFRSLGVLHDYVHTRGIRFSNAVPFPDGGKLRVPVQRFSEEAYEEWLGFFAEVVRFSAVCHLIRYPLGTVKYDWGSKFGIDIPQCGALEMHEVDALEELVSKPVFAVIRPLAETDPHVRHILDWVLEQPDMSPEDVEKQMVEQAIELVRGGGFASWLKMANSSLEYCRREGPDSAVEGWERFIARVTKRVEEEGLLSAPGLLDKMRG